MNTTKLSLPALTLSTLGLICATAPVSADDYSYKATEDFTDINAGVVPYYIDTARDVLAIDAAIEDYRDKFAQASVLFTGLSGIYDVTIVALGEIDGEGEFRFLVNGEVVGSAVNELVDTDWGEQNHVFQDIEVNTGDTIAVESDARSNGLIPENGEFAFARGRWRSAELVFDAAATAAPITVELDVAMESDESQVTVGQAVGYTLTVNNNHADNVATSVQLVVTMTDNLQFQSSDTCTENGPVVTCQVEQLAPGANAAVSFQAMTLEEGVAVAGATVASAQIDSDTSNNTAESVVALVPEIVVPSTGLPPTIDVVDPDGSGTSDQNAGGSDSGGSDQSGGAGTLTSAGASSGGGGGTLSIWFLALLSLRRLKAA